MPGEGKEPPYPKLKPPELKLPKVKERGDPFGFLDTQLKDDLLQALDYLERQLKSSSQTYFPVKDELPAINLWYERARDIINENREHIPLGIRKPIKEYLIEIYRIYLKKWKEAEGRLRKKQGY